MDWPGSSPEAEATPQPASDDSLGVRDSFLSWLLPSAALGLRLPVAAVEDLLRAKTCSAQEPTRRRSKRQKDLVDIARLVEARPELALLVQ